MPDFLRWVLIAIKEVGFPVAVSVGLYFLNVQQAKTIEALKGAIFDMKVSLDANTRAIKRLGVVLHRGHSDDGE